MFIAHDETGGNVTASEAVKNRKYFCPVCLERVVLKSGNVKTHHFSHHRIVDCIRHLYKKESLAHLSAKHELYLTLSRNHKVTMEYYLAEIEQIPDLLVGKRAIEIQYSAISPMLIIERSKGYHTLGMDVIWLLDEMALRVNGIHVIPTHFQLSTQFHGALFTYQGTNRQLKKWVLHHHIGAGRWLFSVEDMDAEALLSEHNLTPHQTHKMNEQDIKRLIQHERRQKSRLNPTLTYIYQLGLNPNDLPKHLLYITESERWIMNSPLEWKLYLMYVLERGGFTIDGFRRFIRLREIQGTPQSEQVIHRLLIDYKTLYNSQ
ncbi:competence protein CoiA family protein [Salinicoccus jeotgali]|uniref:Competence protein CoiA family protein n=1 Tax=Salinicoccus jeotgali TaxID=381634 RepID=A0ABP7F6I8_9STAP